MRELQVGTWVAVMVALVAFGCDDDNGGSDGGGGTDSGMVRTDGGGTGGTDSGTGGGTDGGMMVMVDSGTGGGSCGPADGECALTDPTSCGDGMGCLLSSGTSSCFGAGTGEDGAACDPAMAGQCAEGFGCSSERVCRRWCCSNTDCNPPGMATGQVCNFFANSGPPGQEVGLCAQGDECSPVEQTGCETGEACNLFTLGLTICDQAGDKTEGEACEARNACEAGLACVGSDGGFACRAFCNPSESSPCPTGFACGGITDAPDDVGVCVPMD